MNDGVYINLIGWFGGVAGVVSVQRSTEPSYEHLGLVRTIGGCTS